MLAAAAAEFVDEFGVGGSEAVVVAEELASCAVVAVFINISLSFFLLLKYSVVDVSL